MSDETGRKNYTGIGFEFGEVRVREKKSDPEKSREAYYKETPLEMRKGRVTHQHLPSEYVLGYEQIDLEDRSGRTEPVYLMTVCGYPFRVLRGVTENEAFGRCRAEVVSHRHDEIARLREIGHFVIDLESSAGKGEGNE